MSNYAELYVVTAILEHDGYNILEDPPGSTRSQKKYRGICTVDMMKPFYNNTDSESEDDPPQNGNVSKIDVSDNQLSKNIVSFERFQSDNESPDENLAHKM